MDDSRRLPMLRLRDDLAYILPMAAFVLLVTLGEYVPSLYIASYYGRAIAAGLLLIAGRGAYTRISWKYWWLGIIVGVIGTFQWIGMQLWLQHHFAFFRPNAEKVFDPFVAFSSPGPRDIFIAFRWILSASIIVPFMEELFWRDFLWRQIIAPSNFKLANIGEWSPVAFVGVALAFCTVHGNWWLTAIVWGLMIGGLLLATRSLGACIVCHAVTNFLLGAYVLWSRDWSFW